MKILTKSIKAKLLANGKSGGCSCKPVLKLFNPCGAATWLITEIDEHEDMMYGLCDLGLGSPELGYVSLRELMAAKLPFGLKIERDMHFKADKTLEEYAAEARENGMVRA